ncbi:MAG: TetR family transcriptional regulator [Dactylosporangium sp.]|nr:TetR family transcriptional regulator [Dactylosporangium sp.]NNJ62074.1 TetR family transcriptional regulator [Dactylosporangium sp.]
MNTIGRETSGIPLRVRKRNRTRRALQRAAIDLVEQHGYQATSVDEICARAEVSRSTFFRYFGSKDAVFQPDILEEEVIELLDAPGELSLQVLEDRLCAGVQDLSPEDWDIERRRMRLLLTVPELRASLLSEFFRPFPLAIGYVARMLDLPPDSARVRTVAGAIIGALAVHQMPDASGNYELPASTEDAIMRYRGTFRELDHILDLNRLRGS